MKKLLRNIFLIAALAGTSCESLVDDFNVDPNNPSDAPSDLIAPSAILTSAFVQEGELARLTGMWSGYFTGSDRQYIGLGQYNATAGDFDSPWGNLYSSAANQADIIIKKEEAKTTPDFDGQNYGLSASARIVKSYVMGTATNLWGDIPYNEAFNVEEFPNPSYQDQASVYAAVQADLQTAIDDLEDVLSGDKNGTITDITALNGDIQSWIEVAHTLKARFYMHTKEYANAYSEAQLGVSSSAGDLNIDHGTNIGVDANSFFVFLEWERSGYMTADEAPIITTIQDRNNSKTDETARLRYLYTDAGWYSSTWEPNSHPNAAPFAWGGEANGFFDHASTYPLVTYHENLLILAEAAARTVDFNTALGHLNEFRTFMSTGGYIHSQYTTDYTFA